MFVRVLEKVLRVENTTSAIRFEECVAHNLYICTKLYEKSLRIQKARACVHVVNYVNVEGYMESR